MYQSQSNRWGLLGVVALLVFAGTALAQAPQTIVIDGINDFLPVNNIDADAADVQVPEHPQLDIQNLHLTNDAVNLYVGFEKHPSPYGSTQFGIAIDVGTVDGGSTDPWGRAIEWSLATNKPDFMFYINLDSGWQAAMYWDGAAWQNLSAGPGALGWVTNTEFSELAIMLGTLGVAPGGTVNIDLWLTQDASTKGPLDAMANDASQLSNPGSTLWDTATAIPMFTYHAYTVQAAADPDPPFVQKMEPASYPVDSFFDVYFNEPVSTATAENPANYGVTGASVVSATRDGTDPSIVHLVLDNPLVPSASLYQVTVSNVQDLAGNPITEDGVDNTACMGLKEVIFRGKMGPFIANLGVSGPYTFTVEGDRMPLTFGPICDGDSGAMTDIGGDVYENVSVMAYKGDCGAGTAAEDFEWKFAYDCSQYEPLGSNRVHTLDIAGGATDVLEFWWNDEDPTQFTQQDIDVEFFVDMNATAWAPGDSVSIGGNVPPLSFDTPPVNQLVDDGTGNDAVAGDGIWSTVITFPAGSKKDVNYKFLLNSEFECLGQGDRYLFLNDEAFDTIGGTLGPLTMPLARYDFCNAIWRAVEVHFSVDMSGASWDVMQPTDVVSVNGTPNNAEPPTFDWTVPSLNDLADDGVYPDATAGDGIYTVAVVFPDTSAQFVEYKYLFNDIYECFESGNHTFNIDPDNYDDQGNPQILPVDVFNPCGIASVPDLARGLVLEQNTPNPFNPSTEIMYSVRKAGTGSLRIYNVRGEVVRTLRSGQFPSGPGRAVWDGATDAGTQAGSGVYFYRLEVGAQAVTKRMVLLK